MYNYKIFPLKGKFTFHFRKMLYNERKNKEPGRTLPGFCRMRQKNQLETTGKAGKSSRERCSIERKR